MNIYIYSDESGVFDHIHNKYFVFGGLIIIGDTSKGEWSHKYANVENTIRQIIKQDRSFEIKATTISNTHKDKIFRSLNHCYKFACIVEEDRVNSNIWNSKKDKQRYLDYVYKISVKRALEHLIDDEVFIPADIERLYFYVDEHSTATNGKYELREALEQEFKYGTFNTNYSRFFPPIFPNLKDVQLEFCDSSAPNKRLVRGADIVANKIYYLTTSGQQDKFNKLQNITITIQP